MYQIYNKKELKNCNKKYLYKDIYYSNTEDKDIESQLDNLEEKIFNILNSNNNDTLFENIKISKTNIFGDKKIFFIPVDKIYDDYLILNTLKFNLEKAFQTKTSNRNTSIKSIKKILESFAGNLKDDFELHICKLDIKDFFESIKLKKIIDELYKRNILSNISFKILYQLLDAIVKKINLERLDYDKIGLPRGLNISSTLSEYYMQPIDNEIKKLDTVLYYTRYVDDIIIISSKKIEDNVIKIIKNKDLTINSEKTRSIEISKNSKEITFDYLGYCFDGYYTSNQKELKSNQKELKWKISISKHKINKIKNKIYYCFKCYKKNKKKLGDKDSIQILEKQIKSSSKPSISIISSSVS
jgi:hypothetical protein